ncbi:hypothetical protein, partial [Mycobacterium intracellulare]
RLLPHERRQTPKGATQTNLGITARAGYFHLATSGYFNLAIDSRRGGSREGAGSQRDSASKIGRHSVTPFHKTQFSGLSRLRDDILAGMSWAKLT